jgi:hypothetical protein
MSELTYWNTPQARTLSGEKSAENRDRQDGPNWTAAEDPARVTITNPFHPLFGRRVKLQKRVPVHDKLKVCLVEVQRDLNVYVRVADTDLPGGRPGTGACARLLLTPRSVMKFLMVFEEAREEADARGQDREARAPVEACGAAGSGTDPNEPETGMGGGGR